MGPVALLIIWLTLVNYVFVIRNVEVVGAGSVPATDVVRLSNIGLGGRMNAIDEQALQAAVESDGRLAYEGIEKRYPTTIRLKVRERSRDALVLQAGKVLILDSDGYVVAVVDQLPAESMPYVTGLKPAAYHLGHQLDVADGRLGAMKAVLEALKAHDAMPYVSEINVESLRELHIITRTGMRVTLGDAENMNDKIVWMVGALRDLEARGETIGVLDVSSATKADFLSYATPTPAPTAEPTPEPTPEGMAEIGEGAI